MLNFLNFLIMLVWSFTKLGMAVLLLCVTLLCLKPILKETVALFAELAESFSGCWEEIRIMERSEYGE